MTPDSPNVTENREDDSGLTPEAIASDAVMPQDLASVAPLGAASSDTSPEKATLSQQELAGLSGQLTEAGQ